MYLFFFLEEFLDDLDVQVCLKLFHWKCDVNNRTIEILFRKFRGSTRRYKRFYHCIYLFF